MKALAHVAASIEQRATGSSQRVVLSIMVMMNVVLAAVTAQHSEHRQ
jgi:hypothetical protein